MNETLSVNEAQANSGSFCCSAICADIAARFIELTRFQIVVCQKNNDSESLGIHQYFPLDFVIR